MPGVRRRQDVETDVIHLKRPEIRRRQPIRKRIALSASISHIRRSGDDFVEANRDKVAPAKPDGNFKAPLLRFMKFPG